MSSTAWFWSLCQRLPSFRGLDDQAGGTYIVDVYGSSNDCCSHDWGQDDQYFPKTRMVGRESLQFRIQVQREEDADREGGQCVSTWERFKTKGDLTDRPCAIARHDQLSVEFFEIAGIGQ